MRHWLMTLIIHPAQGQDRFRRTLLTQNDLCTNNNWVIVPNDVVIKRPKVYSNYEELMEIWTEGYHLRVFLKHAHSQFIYCRRYNYHTGLRAVGWTSSGMMVKAKWKNVWEATKAHTKLMLETHPDTSVKDELAEGSGNIAAPSFFNGYGGDFNDSDYAGSEDKLLD